MYNHNNKNSLNAMYNKENPRLSPLIPSQKLLGDGLLAHDPVLGKLLKGCFNGHLVKVAAIDQRLSIYIEKPELTDSKLTTVEDAEDLIIGMAHKVTEQKSFMPHSVIRQCTYLGQRNRRGSGNGALMNEKTFRNCNWKTNLKNLDEEIIIGRWRQSVENFLNIEIWFGDHLLYFFIMVQWMVVLYLCRI